MPNEAALSTPGITRTMSYVWLQNVRMVQTKVDKIIFLSKPEGRRKVRMFILRRLEDVKNDLQELKVKRQEVGGICCK
jgi:hypothetical protein